MIAAAPFAHAISASIPKHAQAHARPAVHPGPAVVRGFARTALHYLKGPAQRPFLNLLKSLPPQTGEVDISKGKTQNINCDPASNTCVPTAANAVLNVKDLGTMLRSGSWTIGTTADAPDIVVDAGFGWSSGNGLTFNAIGNIIVNQAIVVERPPNPNFQLIYNATGGGGTLSFGPQGSIVFWDLASPLVINGQNYILANNIQSLAQLIQRNPSGNFALANSYDAKKDGTYSQSPIQTTFAGNFEGLGNTISNFQVESSQESQSAGFFHEVGQTARVENLNLKSTKMELSGVTIVGGLADLNEGTLFSNSWSGDIGLVVNSGDNCAIGDLAGMNEGEITYSHASGSVNVTSTVWCYVGGLVGSSGDPIGVVEYSYALGPVTATALGNNAFEAGGLVGDLNSTFFGTIAYTFATGAVTQDGGGFTGGLLGRLDGVGSIVSSTASGSVTVVNGGSLLSVGGLIGDTGFSSGVVEATVATGSVSGSGGLVNAGGAIGSASVPVDDSESFGTVSGTGGTYYVGGFVGYVENGTPFVNDGWDTTTSNIKDPGQGAGNIRYYQGITGFN